MGEEILPLLETEEDGAGGALGGQGRGRVMKLCFAFPGIFTFAF